MIREIFRDIKEQSNLYHKRHLLKRSKAFSKKIQSNKNISEKPVWEKQPDGTYSLYKGNNDYIRKMIINFDKGYNKWIQRKEQSKHTIFSKI